MADEKEKKKKKICFAASSGGHYVQLMKLKTIIQEYDSFVITEYTSGTRDCPYPVHFLELTNRKEKNFPILMVKNSFKTFKIMLKERPDFVISTGVLSMIPACLIGKLLGAKLIYIESFAKTETPTQTGKLLYHFADHFMVQWPGLLKVYPKAVYKGGLY